MTSLALAGATVYTDPRSEPLRGATVVIDGNTIASVGHGVPHDAQKIDCAGLTITAGFWNSHVHFFERQWANAASIPAAELQRQLDEFLTRYGFVSVFDLSSQRDNTRILRERIESGEVNGPRIFTTGEGLIPPGGAAPELSYRIMGLTPTPLFEPADARAATDIVKRLLDDGVDGIKLFLSAPNGSVLARDVVDAAIAEAHRANKPVFAHPNTARDVATALSAGVDVLAHTTPRETWGDGLKPVTTFITPTLWIWQFYARHDRASLRDQWRANPAAQLRSWPRGRILFGTDLGAVDPDPAPEYQLMREAGMSFEDILESLTTAPASLFGGSARVVAGARADLAVWRGSLDQVCYTFRDGRLICSNISTSR